jgi:hypothetical protein
MIDSAPMRSAGFRLAVIAAAGAIVLGASGGCGNNEQSASDAAQGYVDARNQHDYPRVCRIYTDQLRQKLTGGLVSCETFVKEQSTGVVPGPFKVLSVHEQGDHAVARLETTGESGESVQLKITLQKQNGGWAISALGPFSALGP